jgi:sugar phosphate isomerase/epimerase
MSTRRRFLARSLAAAAAVPFSSALASVTLGSPSLKLGDTSGPHLQFPAEAHERIAIASYPFRDFIAGDAKHGGNSSAQRMDIKDFAAHVAAKFNIRKIEPWSRHFRSTEARYLEEFRAALEKARGAMVNIAVDGDHSAYAMDRAEREKAVAFGKEWIDVAAAIGSPSVRMNIAEAKYEKPDLERAAESLHRVAEHGAAKNVVVNLENDNAVTEDPFFLVQLIKKVNSPWLHANPDFCNTLATGNQEYAYRGIEAMFQHAYCICHVKAMEENEHTGEVFRVDMAKTFGILKSARYLGYCSMEFDSPGDPYAGTSLLIEQTLQYL